VPNQLTLLQCPTAKIQDTDSGAATGAAASAAAVDDTVSDGKQPVLIAVYNYKGGAAKTTTALNLASVMAHIQNKRVLLIDCDAQCNLTSFMFPDTGLVEEGPVGDDDSYDEDDPVAESP
jgi:Mrp family chromosome partitioning ATPase